MIDHKTGKKHVISYARETFSLLLTTLFLVAFSSLSLAQNVGIGIDDPSTKLDVDGVITATDGNSSDWNEAHGWGNHNLAGYLLNELDPKIGSIFPNRIPRWTGTKLSDGAILDNGSNIAIGAFPRSEKLYVAGKSYFQENIGIGGPPLEIDTMRLFVEGSSRLNGHASIQKGISVYGTSYFSQNVGIGAFPSVTVSLNAGSTKITGTGHITGNVGIGGEPSSEKLYVAGRSYFQDNIGIGGPPMGNDTTRLFVNGSSFFQGYMLVQKKLSSNEMSVSGITRLFGNVGIGASANNNKLFVLGTSRFEGNSTTTGTSALVGNVGIGAAANSNRLFVDGTANVTGNTQLSGNVGIGAPANSNRLFVDGTANVTGSTLLSGNVGIGAAANSNRLFVDGTANITGSTQLSGNVGIGLPASPDYKLYVLGNTFNLGNFLSSGTGFFQGNVGIGTTPTINKLEVNGNTRINGNIGLGKAPAAIRLDVNGSIQISGAALKPGGGLWSTSSDRRLKKDICPYNDGLNEILQIKAVNYKYNELSGYDTNQSHVGVIAQELREIAPYMVSDHNIGGKSYLQVDPSAMTYMLVNAIQEQQEEINELKAKLGEKDAAYNDLNEKVDTLLKQMVKLEASMTSKADTGNADHIGEK